MEKEENGEQREREREGGGREEEFFLMAECQLMIKDIAEITWDAKASEFDEQGIPVITI